MEIQQLDILLRLIIAHLLADFIFQSNKMVDDKNEYGLKSISFYTHLAIVGITAYLMLAEWTNWRVPVALIIR